MYLTGMIKTAILAPILLTPLLRHPDEYNGESTETIQSVRSREVRLVATSSWWASA